MAKAVLSPMFTSLRGKLGNGILQVWKGIQIVRQMPSVISQPNSAYQMLARERMNSAFVAWTGLSGPNKVSWGEMADIVKDYEMPPGGNNNLINPLGGAQSGMNCFINFYLAALSGGQAAISGAAPLSEERPNAPAGVAVAYDNVTHTATVTWTDPVEVTGAARVRCFIRSQNGIYHVQKSFDEALAVQTKAVTSARGSGGSTIAFSIPEASGGTRITVQMDTVNPSGNRSMASNVSAVTIV
jgi:hypothetical protein